MARCVRKEPCPKCGSRDNLARYDDGGAHCFGCQYHEFANQEPRETQVTSETEGAGALLEFLQGTPMELKARGIKKETCEFWKYEAGVDEHGPFQIARYFDRKRREVAQKVRRAKKQFQVRGSGAKMSLYGQWLWPAEGKRVVVTEGEIDALTVSQVFNNSWPVVSLPKGAAGALRAVTENLDWLSGYDQIVLMFDMDEPGREAAEACAAILPVGKAYIASTIEKDANESLVKHGVDAVSHAVFKASPWRPGGIKRIRDIKQKALQPPEMGLPWWCDTLTKHTYGRRYGEIYTFGAGTGVGKTDFLMQQIAFDTQELKMRVGLHLYEIEPDETAKRIAGKIDGQCYHVPQDQSSWTQEALQTRLDAMDVEDRCFIFDHFGSAEWEELEKNIRFLTVADGVRIHYIDHLTALADPSNERESLETIMKRLGGLVKELKIIVILVSHLTTPEKGKSHEEGGRVTIRHFKGSRSIGFWSPFMFGLERDQQADDPIEATTTTFRILKDRYTGRSTGKVFYLGYDAEKGTLHETSPEFAATPVMGDPHTAL